MKKRLLTLAFTLLTIAQIGAFGSVSASALFTDTDGHWAEETIDELANLNIINGKGEGIYDPEGTLTHGEFMKLLTCAVDIYQADATFEKGTIADVTPSDWFYPYVASGLKAAVFDVSSLKNGNFLPENGISRGEVAIWMTNALGIESTGSCGFSDVKDSKVMKAVVTAVNEGLVKGYEDNTYRPDNTLTRAEAAVVIKRVMEKYAALNTVRESSNTATMSENVRVMTSGKENEIVSLDESTRTAVFENCSDDFKALKVGDVFWIESCEKFPDGVAGKVEKITVSGSKVTMVIGAPTITEMFDSIDIAKKISATTDNYVAGSGGDNVSVSAVSYMKDADGNEFIAEDGDNSLICFTISKGSTKTLFEAEESFSDNGLSGKLTVKADIFADVLLQGGLDGKKFETTTYVTTTMYSSLSYKKEASFTKEWPLGSFSVPIIGPLSVNLDCTLVFNAKGEFEIKVEAYESNRFGIQYANGTASIIKNNESSATLSANAKGEVRIGPKMDIGLGVTCMFLSCNAIDLEAQLGLGVDAETSIEHKLSQTNGEAAYTANNITPDDEGNVHICELCIDGSIFVYLDGDVGVSRDITKLIGCNDIRLKFGDHKFPITDWYCSISTEKGITFGLGNCPNLYKTIKITKEPQDVKVKTGEKAVFDVETGVGLNGDETTSQAIVYKWYKDGKEIPEEFSDVLTLTNVTEEDAGKYHCVAYYSGIGEKSVHAASREVTLVVEAYTEGPEFTVQPASQTVNEGTAFILNVETECPAGLYATYQWYKDGAPIAGKDSASYSVINATQADAGSYYCVAKYAGHDAASQSETVTVTVNEASDAEEKFTSTVKDDEDIFNNSETNTLVNDDGNTPAESDGNRFTSVVSDHLFD